MRGRGSETQSAMKTRVRGLDGDFVAESSLKVAMVVGER